MAGIESLRANSFDMVLVDIEERRSVAMIDSGCSLIVGGPFVVILERGVQGEKQIGANDKEVNIVAISRTGLSKVKDSKGR